VCETDAGSFSAPPSPFCLLQADAWIGPRPFSPIYVSIQFLIKHSFPSPLPSPSSIRPLSLDFPMISPISLYKFSPQWESRLIRYFFFFSSPVLRPGPFPSPPFAAYSAPIFERLGLPRTCEEELATTTHSSPPSFSSFSLVYKFSL